jgi:hypothetical protein
MKQILFGAFLLATVMPVEQVTTQSAGSTVEGTWSARVYVSDREGADATPKLQLQMNIDSGRSGGWDNWGQSMPLAAFTGLPRNLDPRQDVRFELRRDAGVVTFDGRFENERGVGTLAFVPYREFARVMEQQTNDTFTDRELLSYAILDVSRAFVTELQGLGFRDVTLADARKLRIHGTTIDFIKGIRAAGYPDVDLDRIVKLRIHGVTPAFIAGIKAEGLTNPSLAEVTKFRIHGVTLDYIKQMRALGLADDLDDIVDSRIHGVTPAFAKDMAALGYGKAGFSQLRKFRIHGVTPSFVREMASLGYKNVDADTLVKFRIHGITPSFVKELSDAGYTNLSEQELVDWAIHGRRLLKTRKR